MLTRMTRMARLLTHMLTRMTRWLAGSHIIHTRANWSCDPFEPMRRRACVYQQTNQNMAPVIKNF